MRRRILVVGLTAAGPLVIATLLRGKNVTAGGLLAGAVVTLTGTGGQLAVIVFAAHGLDLGGFHGWVWALGGIGAVLLATYSIRSLLSSLDEGVKPPKKTTTKVSVPVHRHRAQEGTPNRITESPPDAEEQEYVHVETVGEVRRRSAVL